MKKLIILTALVLGLGTAQVEAQGFLGKLKNKGTQLLKGKANKAIDKVIDKATPQVVKDATKKVNRAEANVRRSTNRATSDRVSSFHPAKKTITVKFCEGVGRKEWYGRVGGVTPTPPENGPAQVKWIDGLTPLWHITNARLAAEYKMMDKWVADDKPYLEPTMVRREGCMDEYGDRVEALQKVVKIILRGDKEEEDDALGAALESPYFKRAVASDWSALYPSLDKEVVEWLKSIDRTTKTLSVVVSEGNSAEEVRMQMGEMWFKVNTARQDATLEYLDMDQSEGRDYVVPASITYAGRTFRVTSISDVAFASLKVRSVTLSEGLKTIGRQAFARTRIASINIPSTVTKIDYRAFAENPALKTITVPNNVRELGIGMLAMCTALTSATLPETVDRMQNSTFWGCTALKQVRLPQNITTLPDLTFEGCKALTHVDLPAGLTVIEQNAFKGSGLTSITFPQGLTEIKCNAFEGCNRLTQVSIPNSAKVDFMAFKDCKALKKVAIGARYKATPYELYSIFMGCSFVNPRMTTTPACVTYNE